MVSGDSLGTTWPLGFRTVNAAAVAAMQSLSARIVSAASSSDGEVAVHVSPRLIRLLLPWSGEFRQYNRPDDHAPRLAALARDAKRFVTVDSTGQMMIWSPVSKAPDGRLRMRRGPCAVSLSPDASRTAVGFEDGSTTIIETASGKIVEELGGSSAVTKLLFASTDTLALGYADGSLVVWHNDTSKTRFAYFEHSGAITDLGASSETRFYTASRDGTVRINAVGCCGDAISGKFAEIDGPITGFAQLRGTSLWMFVSGNQIAMQDKHSGDWLGESNFPASILDIRDTPDRNIHVTMANGVTQILEVIEWDNRMVA